MGWRDGHNGGQHFYLVSPTFHLMSIENTFSRENGEASRALVQPDVMSALVASLVGIGQSKARSRSIQAASVAFGDKDK